MYILKPVTKSIFYFQDHLSSIDRKWPYLDDEVWAKIVVLEKNNMVAKAYIKTPMLSIDGSNKVRGACLYLFSNILTF